MSVGPSRVIFEGTLGASCAVYLALLLLCMVGFLFVCSLSTREREGTSFLCRNLDEVYSFRPPAVFMRPFICYICSSSRLCVLFPTAQKKKSHSKVPNGKKKGFKGSNNVMKRGKKTKENRIRLIDEGWCSARKGKGRLRFDDRVNGK